MAPADYDKLTQELSSICNSYLPHNGPHEPNEIFQHFDLKALDEAAKNDEHRAVSIATLTRYERDPKKLEAAVKAENLYYDQRQQRIDRTIDDAERATCKANNVPLRSVVKDQGRSEEPIMSQQPNGPQVRQVEIYDRDREDISRETKENISRAGGEAVNRASFIGEVPKLPSKPKEITEPTTAVKPPEHLTPQPKPPMPWFLQTPEPKAEPAQTAKQDKPVERQEQTRVVTPDTKRNIPGRIPREDFER
jgi:hypothetical protein